MARGFTKYAYAFLQQPAELGAPLDQAKVAMARARRLYLRARDYGADGLKITRGVGLGRAAHAGGDGASAEGGRPAPLLDPGFLGAAIAANKRDLELVGDVPLIASLLDRVRCSWTRRTRRAPCTSFRNHLRSGPAGRNDPAEAAPAFRARPATRAGETISYLVTYAQAVSGPARTSASTSPVEGSRVVRHRSTEGTQAPAGERAGAAPGDLLLAHEDDVFLD